MPFFAGTILPGPSWKEEVGELPGKADRTKMFQILWSGLHRYFLFEVMVQAWPGLAALVDMQIIQHLGGQGRGVISSVGAWAVQRVCGWKKSI